MSDMYVRFYRNWVNVGNVRADQDKTVFIAQLLRDNVRQWRDAIFFRPFSVPQAPNGGLPGEGHRDTTTFVRRPFASVVSSNLPNRSAFFLRVVTLVSPTRFRPQTSCTATVSSATPGVPYYLTKLV